MGMHADEDYGTALVRRLQREYNNMIIDSFGTPDTPAFRAKLEKKDIELKIAEAQSARQEDLPFSEIDRLIAETEEEWNVQTPSCSRSACVCASSECSLCSGILDPCESCERNRARQVGPEFGATNLELGLISRLSETLRHWNWILSRVAREALTCW